MRIGRSDGTEEVGINIVAIGGGTGLSVLLRGLKKITEHLTAIVTVADDGGGSGILREDLGMLPPGDIRNCILALANEEPVLQELFDYRFSEGRLAGQSFGNLMIAAMLGISGSFEEAIKRVSDIFAITGEVFPATESSAYLRAELRDGTIVYGESAIPQVAFQRKSPIARIWAEPEDLVCSQSAIRRVETADLIILGPGSLFTSVIPPLMVRNLVDAVNASDAKIFYISNIMTQMGETDGFTPCRHVDALLRHTNLARIDHVLVNRAPIDKSHTEKYLGAQSSQSLLFEADRQWFRENHIHLIEGDFIAYRKGYVVHDADAIGSAILENFERRYWNP